MIVVIGALTLSIGLRGVLAQENTVSGWDYGYSQQSQYGEPWFCQCNHAGTPGANNDYEAGLSVNPTYTLYNGVPVFDYCSWVWEDEAGGSLYGGTQYTNVYQQNSPMYIWANVNGGQGNEGYYYSEAIWEVPPPNGNYHCWLVYDSMAGSINYVSSVEGETLASFYQVSNPSNVLWISAITQNTAQQPNGNGYEFLTAQW